MSSTTPLRAVPPDRGSTLTIANLTLTASRYKEKRRAAGGLWVELISTVEGGENARLLQLLRESFRARRYYPASRDGEPLGDLRLGLPLWSRREDRTSYHLVLLDREWDEWTDGPDRRSRARPSAAGWLGSAIGKLGELLALLERRRMIVAAGTGSSSTEIDRSWRAQFAIHEIDDVNRAWAG